MTKEYWITETSAYNGTVTMLTEVAAFPTKELAEETAKAINEANKDIDFYTSVSTIVKKITFFETREDVPILNRDKEDD